MARYNEILVGRFARGVQKLFGMKGEVPVGSLAGELSIAHVFASGAENRYLEGWDRFGAIITQPAVAAQFSAIRLRNAPTQNMIAVIEKITFACPLVDTLLLNFGLSTADLATVVTLTQANFDPRGRPAPSATLSRTTLGAAVTPSHWQGNAAVNTTVDIIGTDIQEFVLPPNSQLTVGSNTANQALTGTIWWRERYIEESERT